MAVPPPDQWRRSFDRQPLHRLLGIHADEIGEGYVQLRVRPGGGSPTITTVSTFAISTAADLTVVTAVSTTVDRRRDTMNGTAELNLTYVAEPGDEAVVRGTVHHRGSTVAIVEIRVTDAAGGPLAYGRGTYSIRPGAEA